MHALDPYFETLKKACLLRASKRWKVRNYLLSDNLVKHPFFKDTVFKDTLF